MEDKLDKFLTKKVLLVLIIINIIITVFLFFYCCRSVNIEGLTTEAIETIASMLNSGEMKVTNLQVTGTAKIGNWNIRNDRIGIQGRGDLHLHTDKLCRLRDYDKDTFAGHGTANGGFAGENTYSQNSSVAKNYAGNVTTNSLRIGSNQGPVITWDNTNKVLKIPATTEFNNALARGLKPEPSIIVENIVSTSAPVDKATSGDVYANGARNYAIDVLTPTYIPRESYSFGIGRRTLPDRSNMVIQPWYARKVDKNQGKYHAAYQGTTFHGGWHTTDKAINFYETR